MMIRNMFTLVVVAGPLVLGAAGCAQPKYVHCVYFDVRDDAPAGEIDALVADGHTLLAKVPTVRRVETGCRDTDATRDVNDQTFDVGLVVYFDDQAGLDAYIEHPTHIEYVDKHKAHWAGVKVFDFIAK